MRYRAVVYACGHPAFAGVIVFRLLSCGHVRVVILITPEDVQLLAAPAQAAYTGKYVVAGLYARGDGVLAHRGLPVRGFVGRQVSFYRAYSCRVPDVPVVGVSAHNPIEAVEREVNRAYRHFPLYGVVGFFVAVGILALEFVGERVVHRTAVVAAQPDAQAGHGVVV